MVKRIDFVFVYFTTVKEINVYSGESVPLFRRRASRQGEPGVIQVNNWEQ